MNHHSPEFGYSVVLYDCAMLIHLLFVYKSFNESNRIIQTRELSFEINNHGLQTALACMRDPSRSQSIWIC